ncbi:hypothetical protein IE81DRAFT_329695 [Ceraceosorus guamensis]|uniref:Uncharacterized protein n=1 Tax=Ceraceosorus guamensis TaxID=1522189 RepID=A0A316W0J1_9BASI|nr:hypothetical protein IE81DRAFT_329695 [Ceraceosorus guamensis]PWN43209.1 hypothetical protein IE81DRAFT_329695 [Ceraceosorus guamensis]
MLLSSSARTWRLSRGRKGVKMKYDELGQACTGSGKNVTAMKIVSVDQLVRAIQARSVRTRSCRHGCKDLASEDASFPRIKDSSIIKVPHRASEDAVCALPFQIHLNLRSRAIPTSPAERRASCSCLSIVDPRAAKGRPFPSQDLSSPSIGPSRQMLAQGSGLRKAQALGQWLEGRESRKRVPRQAHRSLGSHASAFSLAAVDAH